MNYPEFSDLIGKEFVKVNATDDELRFWLTEDSGYKLFHFQDCCESVYIEDICGDLSDLEGTPIIEAEVSTNDDQTNDDSNDYCAMWTFYKIRTIKGSVTIRWYGSSNGYYGVGVNFDTI